MTTVFSPHTDDAIFSIGAYLSALTCGVVIASPMAGIPSDDVGRAKHELLRKEHAAACRVIGATDWRNGDFLDDVYPAPSRRVVRKWLALQLACADVVLIPFGIHHPDHLLISNLLISLIDSGTAVPDHILFYEELPYRVDYPALAASRFAYLENRVGRLRMLEAFTDDTLKRQAVNEYQSQITGGDVVERVMVRERIWELVR